MSSSVAAGLGIALAASACFEGAYVLQAMEARRVHQRHALRGSLLFVLARRGRWLAGGGLVLAGVALQVVAFQLAPVAVVQPVLALGLVLLLYLGHRVLGEPVGRRELLAVAAIVAGVVVLALLAPPVSDSLGPALGLGVALGALGLLVVAPFVAQRLGGRVDPRLLIVSAGAGDAWAALALKLLSVDLSHQRWAGALAWGVGAGLAGVLGLTAEMTALQRLPATRVAPPILVAQVVIPVGLAPVVAGERLGSSPAAAVAVCLALATVAGAAAVLGASTPVRGLEVHDEGAAPAEARA
jgi:drug/metabolite transporter (DMT)-like permease